jgi:hypothetical protein
LSTLPTSELPEEEKMIRLTQALKIITDLTINIICQSIAIIKTPSAAVSDSAQIEEFLRNSKGAQSSFQNNSRIPVTTKASAMSTATNSSIISKTLPQPQKKATQGVNKPNMQGGYIKNPLQKPKSKGNLRAPLSPKVPQFPAEVKSNIVRAIDDYRLNKGKNLELQADIARIAEDYNIPLPQRYGDLIAKFQQILDITN